MKFRTWLVKPAVKVKQFRKRKKYLRITALPVHCEGCWFVYITLFLQSIVQNSSDRDQWVVRSIKYFRFGYRTSTEGCSIFTYVFIPHLPTSDINHLNKEMQKAWNDDIILLTIRMSCSSYTFQYHLCIYQNARKDVFTALILTSWPQTGRSFSKIRGHYLLRSIRCIAL